MAVDRTALTRVSYGNGQGLLLYKSADAQATIIAANYFAGMQDILMVNDVILAVASTGGTTTLATLLVQAVTATTSTVVKTT